MTKSQIKAELRRSACEDFTIWEVKGYAFNVALKFKDPNASEYFQFLSDTQQRIFFLLVAEAL